MNKRVLQVGLTALGLLLAACVTVNIYFPAPAMQDAAEKIVKEVWGSEGQKPPAREKSPASPPASPPPPHSRLNPASLLTAFLDILVAPVQAADINVSTAAIRSLKERIRERSGRIIPFMDNGAVGIDAHGKLVLRSEEGLSIHDRAEVRRLLEAENRDREELYQEIAKANDHPEWAGEVRGVFAEKWRQEARSGWWLQSAGGNWQKK
ncbi:MAG: YdbL family protein [Magnetococcus sp. DMHC-1]|nr:YdbL family protein [Magnetococcales bacterium]